MQRKANKAKTPKTTKLAKACRCYWCATKPQPLYPDKPNTHLLPRGFHGHY